MRTPSIATVITGALLVTAAVGSFLLPSTLSVPEIVAALPTPPEEIRLTTLIRDMKSDHPDFNVVPAAGFGHYAGIVAASLGDDGRPVRVAAVETFDVTNGNLIPGEPFAAEATVLGAELTSGGTPVPITLKVQADADTHEPFGMYDYTADPTGDVNDGNNPRHHVFTLEAIYSPGTVLAVEATSWVENASGVVLGHSTIGGNQLKAACHTQYAMKVTLPYSGTVTAMNAYVRGSGSDPDLGKIRYAIYSDSGGEPGTLIVESAESTTDPSWQWNTMAIPATALAAGDYWLALSQHDETNESVKVFSGSGQSRVKAHNAHRDGFTATWGASETSASDGASIYATLTPDAPVHEPHLRVDAGADSPNVFVLRNGDPVPAIPAMADLSTILDFVEPYVDLTTGLMTLQANEAIYLFELGTTDLSSPSADFQDLVVLMRLASDPIYFTNGGGSSPTTGPAGYMVDAQWHDSAGRNIAPHLYEPIGTDNAGNALADAPGTVGVDDGGGVASAASFGDWFGDVLGVNQSTVREMTLVRNVSGVYEYLDNDFHPIDDALFGNDGDGHNHYFTLAFNAQFTYDQGGGQFIEFSGGDGAWLFVNGKLMLDLGGVRSAETQYALIDRLSLVDGQTYGIHFFYAQRDAYSSDFNFRTNIALGGGEILGTVTKPFD